MLSWDDENYYMVAFDSSAQKIKHYRVDKMMQIAIEKAPREGKEAFKNFDMAQSLQSRFLACIEGKRQR